MDKPEFLARLSSIVVGNNWGLPAPGQESDLSRRYHGPDKSIRERIKIEGRKRMLSSLLEQQIIGCGLEAYSHFYRSLESALTQKRKHPECFSEYFPHWMHSDANYVKKEAYGKLSAWFPRPALTRINKGCTYWGFS